MQQGNLLGRCTAITPKGRVAPSSPVTIVSWSHDMMDNKHLCLKDTGKIWENVDNIEKLFLNLFFDV